MERLPLLVGRARALEIVLGAGDFDASVAPSTTGIVFFSTFPGPRFQRRVGFAAQGVKRFRGLAIWPEKVSHLRIASVNMRET